MDIVPWRPDLTSVTVEVLSRAFAKNPIHVAAFGAASVLERNDLFFRVALSILRGRRLVAMEGSRVVGFVHWIESPGCRFSLGQRIGLLPTMLRGFGPGAMLRVSSWLSAWAKNDRRDAHWHFGPIGVDPEAQGHGIGSRLMDVFCTEVDERSAPGFLETDKPENVAFYKRFGFEVVREVAVIGVPTFFMARSGRQDKNTKNGVRVQF